MLKKTELDGFEQVVECDLQQSNDPHKVGPPDSLLERSCYELSD